jgi:hypothetical protein
VQPFREDVVVCVECMLTWYWFADLCGHERIPFVLGHALYMGAIHGGKAKHDRLASHKIAALLRGGLMPQASVSPRRRRARRDRLRRSNHLMHTRAEWPAHSQHTASQNHRGDPLGRIATPQRRRSLLDHVDQTCVRQHRAVDLAMVDCSDPRRAVWARSIEKTAHSHVPLYLALWHTLPGGGNIRALVLRDAIEATICGP